MRNQEYNVFLFKIYLPWAATSFTDCTLVPYLINKCYQVIKIKELIGLIKEIVLQIVVVLARLDEEVGLDVGLHLLH